MKTKHILLFAWALLCVTVFGEHNFQGYANGIGDWNILTLGGYTFTKEESINLAPTNAPDADAQYTISCRVIYRDKTIPRPMSDAEFYIVCKVGETLNSWLNEYVVGECAGQEYEDLFKAFISGKFVENLNEQFPEYIAKKISEEDPEGRPAIDTVTVSVVAEGAFREDLIKKMEMESQE